MGKRARMLFALFASVLMPPVATCVFADDARVVAALVAATSAAVSNPEDRLTLLPKTGACPILAYRFRMGERISIKATGKPAEVVRQMVKQGPRSSTDLSLYVDGMLVPDSSADVYDSDNNAVVLVFDTARDTYSEASRKSWDRIFKTKGDSEMPFVLSVKAGNELPWQVKVIALEATDECRETEHGIAESLWWDKATTQRSSNTFTLYVGSKPAILMTALVCLVAFALVFYILTRTNALRDGGPASLYSLGRSQMAVWGLLVVLAFAGVWFINGTMENIPTSMLVLLGLSGGTGLAAYAIGESKVGERSPILRQRRAERDELLANHAPQDQLDKLDLEIKTLESAPPPVSAGFLHDICNDGTGVSVHRLQMVLWTVMLGVVFVMSVMQTMSMPEFPGSLLILMGVSNLTYLGFKIPEPA